MRDGVAPHMIPCPECGGPAFRDPNFRTRQEPGIIPGIGMRIFVDDGNAFTIKIITGVSLAVN